MKPKLKNLQDSVKATVARHQLMPPGGDAPVLLMVSGGSDSIAMLRILPKLFSEWNFAVLHVNHLLRAGQADEDQRFVAECAEGLGLPCEVRRIDVAALAAQSGDNVEQAGRIARYAAANELLDRLCRQAGVDPALGRIATAHTQDDRAETFLMRVIVGAGAGALSSIPYRNGPVIRPLLDCRRQQLRDWLLQEGEGDAEGWHPAAPMRPQQQGPRSQQQGPRLPPPWCEDASNADTSRLRAFVRHQLIPLAQSRNPELLATVAQSLDNLSCDDALLSRMAKALEEKLVSEYNSVISIAPGLFNEDQALVRRVIHSVCARILPDGQRITAAHILQIAEQGHNVGFVTVIPGAVMVANEYGTLVFWRPDDAGQADAEQGDAGRQDDAGRGDVHGNDAQGAGARGGWHWSVSLEPGCSQLLPDGRRIELAEVGPECVGGDPVGYARRHASATRVFIDGEVLRLAGGSLTVSPWRAGDRICPLGMNGHHRLVSDLLIDRKLPKRLRRGVLKLAGTADNIVWLIGVILDERCKVREETATMFSIIVTGPDELSPSWAEPKDG